MNKAELGLRSKAMLSALVEVTWEDAQSESAHISVEVAKDICPLLRKNYGIILCDEEGKLNMCGGIILNADSSLNSVSGSFSIPRVNIKMIRVIEEGML